MLRCEHWVIKSILTAELGLISLVTKPHDLYHFTRTFLSDTLLDKEHLLLTHRCGTAPLLMLK